MKAVLISVKPKWCELIASGKKTIEVRKPRTEGKEEPMKQDKPIKDWTLGEVQEYCKKIKANCAVCPFDDTKLCGSMFINSPQEWDLTEKPRFTEEEVATARAIVRLFSPNGWTHIWKTEDGYLQLGDKDDESEIVLASIELCSPLFPSILPGQSVRLSEIVGGDDG